MTTRRDVLKYLSVLGVSLAAPTTMLASESEEWRSKPGGVYVMPDVNGATELQIMGTVFGRKGEGFAFEPCQLMWRAYPQEDGSIRLVKQDLRFSWWAARAPGSETIRIVPPEFAPLFWEVLLLRDDPRNPIVRDVWRIDDDQFAQPPLSVDWFNRNRTAWEIIDDRAGWVERHAPFHAVICPMERCGRYAHLSRHPERYVAHIEWE